MKASPAPLCNTTAEFTEQFAKLSPYFSQFQMDICDGKLVPNTTVTIPQYTEMFKNWNPQLLKKISCDFDLMVVDINQALDDLKLLKKYITINTVFAHSYALKNTSFPHSEDFTMGLAIDPNDSIKDLSNHMDLNSIKAIQIMTVNPGFQGSPFLQNQLIKIEQLRKDGYRFLIYMDGGINADTIPSIIKLDYGPDILGIGSFLTKAPKIEERVAYLHEHSIQTT